MVSAIFTELGTIIASFVTLLVNLFESAVGIFYTAGTSSSDPGSLTIVGILTLISVASALVMWAFSFIRRLIRVKAN